MTASQGAEALKNIKKVAAEKVAEAIEKLTDMEAVRASANEIIANVRSQLFAISGAGIEAAGGETASAGTGRAPEIHRGGGRGDRAAGGRGDDRGGSPRRRDAL
jgi:uncharacterized membrane protein